MPTTLTRIQVTQTPALRDALELAAEEWPGVPRSELVARLAVEGGQSLAAVRAARRVARRRALDETRGIFGPDVYPPGYLDDLRKDWPE
ncbi:MULTISPECIES: hypothetical protein [Microbacterium]|uniref:CopG family transcriptional regulator n=1 Tax=Microbacterium profundi TaxID=450380 RepID=A0ABV3LCS4_9MICO|nr:hypothetical protein [Microbacterium profundi]MCE7480717.1 hypothetical protein [Microbacterium profundi]